MLTVTTTIKVLLQHFSPKIQKCGNLGQRNIIPPLIRSNGSLTKDEDKAELYAHAHSCQNSINIASKPQIFKNITYIIYSTLVICFIHKETANIIKKKTFSSKAPGRDLIMNTVLKHLSRKTNVHINGHHSHIPQSRIFHTV